MVEHLATILWSVVPIVVLFVYIYRMDRNRESRVTLAWTFVLGFLGIIPVFILTLLFAPLAWTVHSPVAMTLFSAFALAAIPEETAKLLIIRWFCATRRAFDEPMDGLVYGATAALGFAVLEHIMFVSAQGWSVGPLRAFLCVPGHAAMGAIIGYSIARRMFVPGSRARTWMGWAVAVLIHGMYDAFWMFPDYAAAAGTPSPLWNELGPILAVVVDIGLIVWAIHAFRRERRAQDLAADGGRATSTNPFRSRVERLHESDQETEVAQRIRPEDAHGGPGVPDKPTSSGPPALL